MSRKLVKTAAIAGAACLVLGAFAAAPASAKKGACKKMKPAAEGKGQPISVVTDKATEDAPLAVTVATAPGAGLSSPDGPGGDTPEGGPSHAYANVQVDSAAKSAKLFVRAEYTPGLDYDLYLKTNYSSTVAYAAGFNVPVPAQGLDGTGFGGHTEAGAEQIDGWISADCAGYLVDLVSAATPGGDVTLKFWLAK
ncbi:MAG TPA: hypothetical protein VIG64_05640 [Actinomycetota bacterium]|jgi:hypothetical protein